MVYSYMKDKLEANQTKTPNNGSIMFTASYCKGLQLEKLSKHSQGLRSSRGKKKANTDYGLLLFDKID